MNSDEFTKAYSRLTACPMCRRALEFDSATVDKSCPRHGDFVERNVDGEILLLWNPKNTKKE